MAAAFACAKVTTMESEEVAFRKQGRRGCQLRAPYAKGFVQRLLTTGLPRTIAHDRRYDSFYAADKENINGRF